ncbi:MAG: ABC transporter ATP-binding protein [Tannerellaceae bacterium]|jgi:ABC-2 type transport system ATP-binding protein|nr:ABC transporter ATP-binding protein [Tannerellaceae bacterium]
MINLTNLNFGYRRRKPVLNEINLEIQPGIIYGLLGKNGEGKTTLLHIISGLLFPDTGSCRVFGDEPAKRRADFLQKIFLLPEELLLPDVSVLSYIRMHAPFYPTFSDDILKACVESFEIDHSASLRKMSLGQKKKVAITLALSVHTPLLLMDEPTNGLDIPSKSIFRKLLASFLEEDQTLIISTHQVRDLESLIDAVVILDNKEVVMNRRLDEIAGKLDFRLVSEGEAALYTESSPAGTVGVVPNRTGERSTVSLELLFNAATLAKNDVKRIFIS